MFDFSEWSLTAELPATLNYDRWPKTFGPGTAPVLASQFRRPAIVWEFAGTLYRNRFLKRIARWIGYTTDFDLSFKADVVTTGRTLLVTHPVPVTDKMIKFFVRYDDSTSAWMQEMSVNVSDGTISSRPIKLDADGEQALIKPKTSTESK